MASDARVVLTIALVSSVIGPLILVVANQYLGHRKESADLMSSLQQVAEHALDELQRTQEENLRLRSGSPTRFEVYLRLENGNPPRIIESEVTAAESKTRPFKRSHDTA